MKRIIAILCLLATAGLGQGLGDWPIADYTGAGLSTLDSLYVIGLSRFSSTATFSGSISQSMSTTSGDVDGTRYNTFTVTQSNNPATNAEVSAGYFAINRAFGGNPTYINNAVEGVARQSGIDSAGSGTIRGGLFRTYTTGYVKTQMGLDVSARTGSNAICRGGTGFFGARIYMAPNFVTGFEDSITNFHGLWLYNESTGNKINNGIRINDAGTTGWDTLLNFSGATATVDMVGHSGSAFADSAGGFTFHNRYVTIDSAALRTVKASTLGTMQIGATDDSVGFGMARTSTTKYGFNVPGGATCGFDIANPALAHGMTTLVPTTTYFRVSEVSGGLGGADVKGYSGNNAAVVPMRFIGASGNATPTAAMFSFWTGKKSGMGWAALAATEKLFEVTNNSTPKVTIYGNGNTVGDSFKMHSLYVAKDTSLEVKAFTRTCTRCTLTVMDGADSLTASYQAAAFATRGAITAPPYVGGIVGGKIVIDRPAADTAAYDRVSVVRIRQRL